MNNTVTAMIEKLSKEQMESAKLIVNAQKCEQGIIYRSPKADKYALIVKRDTIIKPGKVRYNFNEYDESGVFVRCKDVCSTSNFRRIMGYIGVRITE